MTLPTVAFGRSDMSITRVGFGAWAIGGGDWAFAWGAQDDAESVAAIRYAIESGINWVDTAAVYGLGHSEEVVAEALHGVPEADRPYVFTKGGLRWDPNDRRRPAERVGDPDWLRFEVEQSLKRLDVERIDLYQLHWPPDDGTPIERYWQTFADLRDAGKVRAIGLSNHRVAQLTVAEAIAHVDSLQPPFSAINRAAAADELPWCADHETGVIVYSPMQSGLLTGAFDEARVASVPEDDWRRRSPEFTTNLSRNLAVGGALARVAERHGVSQAAAAVAWALAFRGVSGAIVGARRPSQIDGWLPAATLTLTDEDLDEVAAAISAAGAGQGPIRPLS